MLVPEADTPDWRVGVEAPETTIVEPPDEGVLNANTSLPTVREYQVLRLQEDAL